MIFSQHSSFWDSTTRRNNSLQSKLMYSQYGRWLFLLLFLGIWVAPLLFAGGRPTEWEPIDIQDAWTHEIDLENRDPGTYNVIIRGIDRAGNQTIEGPFNLRVDPDSDIPQARFIVPTPGQVIRGTTNSIGVALDDDGIDSVLVSINDGPFLPAQGAEYWSFPLQVDDLTDGRHTIRIQPRDINGLEGAVSESWFIVDTQGPEVIINSHDPGTLVRGRVQFSGTAQDANGIEYVQLVLPGYQSLRRGELVHIPEQSSHLRLRTNRQTTEVSFGFTLDTRDMPDGPYTFTLKSRDRVGTITEESVLVFIDNKPPTIQVLYPEPQSSQWGPVTFVGSVEDQVGVERIWYQVGNHSQDIALRPGDRYWYATIDTQDLSGRNPRIRFFAQDRSGNVTQIQHQIRIDSSLHNPQVTMLNSFSPAVGRQPESIDLTEPLFLGISGRHHEYTLIVTGLENDNPRAETIIPSQKITTIDLSHLPPGQRRFTFRVEDPDGNKSPIVTKDLRLVPSIPSLTLDSFRLQSNTLLDFEPGVEIPTLERVSFFGSVKGSGRFQQIQFGFLSAQSIEDPILFRALTQPNSGSRELIAHATQISWSRATLRNQGTEQGYEFSLSRPLDPGLNWIVVKAQDEFNREVVEVFSFRSSFLAIPDGKPRILLGPWDAIPSRVVLEQPLSVSGMVLTRNGVGLREVSLIRFANTDPQADQSEIIQSSQLVQLNWQGNAISLSALGSGQELVQIIAVDLEGRTIQSEPFTLEVRPSALLESSLEVQLEPHISGFSISSQGQTQLQGSVRFTGELSTVAFGLDGAELRTLRTSQTDTPGFRRFTIQLPRNLAPRSEPYQLLIEATDSSGNSDLQRYAFFVLPQTPIDLYTLSNYQQLDVSSMNRPSNQHDQTNRIRPQLLFPFSLEQNPQIVLSEPRTGWFTGPGLPKTVRFTLEHVADDQSGSTPPTESVQPTQPIEVSFKNQVIQLKPVVSGTWLGTIHITDEDEMEYSFGPLEFLVDKSSPVVEFLQPLGGRSLEIVPSFAMSIQDDSTSLEKLELSYRIITEQQVSSWIRVDRFAIHQGNEDVSTNTLEMTPNVTLDRYSGLVMIEVMARDQIGRSTLVSDSFRYVSRSSEVTFISPGTEPINGRTTITGILDEPLNTLGIFLVSAPLGLDTGELQVEFEQHLEGLFQHQDISQPSIVIALDPTSDDSKTITAQYVFHDPQSGNFSVQADFSQAVLQENLLYLMVVADSGVLRIEPIVADVSLADDLPSITLQNPSEGQVVTEDLLVRGMAFDDDGVGAIFWRLNGGDWQEIAGTNNYSFLLPLTSLEDNQQILEIYPVDMFGLAGPTVTRRFYVSKDQPQITLNNPQVNSIHSGTIMLEGTAEDSNGIKRVEVSLDNGVSFFQANGTEQWSYPLDSRVFVDGTYSIQIRAIDSLGIENLVFALVNIDNTPPFLAIARPIDRVLVNEYLTIAGRVEDLGGIETLQLVVDPINTLGESLVFDLPPEATFSTRIPFTGAEPGEYNLQFIAQDKAGNTTHLVRNMIIQEDLSQRNIELFFPLEGEVVSGRVVIEGRISDGVEGQIFQIKNQGTVLGQGSVGPRGFFRYELLAEDLGFGQIPLEIQIESQSSEGNNINLSEPRTFVLNRSGPTVTIDSHQMGDFIANRPWISGTIEYIHTLDPEEPANRQALALFQPKSLRISLDNGRTFTPVPIRGTTWTFRIETDPLPAGPLPVLLEAEFVNGSIGSVRSVFTIDKSYPQITLLTPSEGTRLNTLVQFRGIAEDDHGLESLEISLRPGDKAGYEVPSFIQGMYLDAQFLGLTYWKAGLGFTFFDDNVKLQANFGVGPRTTGTGDPARLSGYFIGGKLLANVFSLPFNAFLGPDWQWLSLNIAIGADFSYIRLYEPITIENPGQPDRVEPGVVLSAIVLQLEFPRVRIEQWGFLNTYSFYTEPQLWFIPSDVSPSVELKLTFGIRIGLF